MIVKWDYRPGFIVKRKNPSSKMCHHPWQNWQPKFLPEARVVSAAKAWIQSCHGAPHKERKDHQTNEWMVKDETKQMWSNVTGNSELSSLVFLHALDNRTQTKRHKYSCRLSKDRVCTKNLGVRTVSDLTSLIAKAICDSPKYQTSWLLQIESPTLLSDPKNKDEPLSLILQMRDQSNYLGTGLRLSVYQL